MMIETHTYIDGLAVFIFVFWCGVWLLHLTSITYGKWKLHRKVRRRPVEVPVPGVSILKPLVGVDPNLADNLETFFTQDYPMFELLFCVEDDSDPALMVVQNLMKKYSSVDAKVFIGGDEVGVNPKINNMQPGYSAARYPMLMVSDSGIRIREDTLLDMVGRMTDKVALVHQVPFAADRPGFAAIVEKIYFGTFHTRIYLMADLVGINCHTGMSSLFRKSVLDEAGGLKSFGMYLAEDFFLCKYLMKLGWKTVISTHPALQNSGSCRFRNFRARLTRWSKLRLAMVPATLVFEPLSDCMLLGVIASWAVRYLFDWDPLIFMLSHSLTWFILDWVLLTIVQNGALPFSKLEYLFGWLVSEIMCPLMILRSLFSQTIRWRAKKFRLKWGGVAEEVKEKPKIKL